MTRFEFITGSLVFHAVLLTIALLLPPPFPSVKTAREDLTYVEVQRVSPGRGHGHHGSHTRVRPGPDAGEPGITFTGKTHSGVLSRERNPSAGASDDETWAKEKSDKGGRAPAPPLKPAAPVRQAQAQTPAQAQAQAKAPPSPVLKPAPVRQALASPARTTPAAPPAPRTVPASPPPAPPSPPPASSALASATQPRFVNPPDREPAPENGTEPAAKEPEPPAVSAARARPAGVTADRDLISFKSIKGWPVPSMVRVKLSAKDTVGGARTPWRAQCDSKWVILSSQGGTAPSTVKVGVDTSKLSLGYYEAKVRFSPADGDGTGDDITVSVMVLPREKGVTELPHYSWDEYMNGNCKVCHLPENLMPSYDFLVQPEFCLLCHNPSGIAADMIPGAGGHPMLVAAGAGGTKMPTHGTVPSGERSDRMDTHFKTGKLIVCVTCHNVMQKPGDYGRAWEMASSGDRSTYYLAKGGWENMGHMEPKVYVTDKLMKLPRRLKDLGRYLVSPKDYSYDEAEGSVTFKRPVDKGRLVYVTLTDPYLRVTTQNNALCYDCHFENTHEGLNCLACHKAHGTANKMGIRELVRTPDGDERRVVFMGPRGKDSFASGGKPGGICEVCHPLGKSHLKYAGTDCTRCHSHKDGFGI